MTRDVTDISVIVAAYQAAGTIGRALGSIAAQTLKPMEVVVVDDGSTDGTASAAEACAEGMDGIRLRVFRSESNLGAGAARNRAIDESTQPVLAFLDADDEWMPEKLERSIAYLEDGNLALVAHDYVTGEGVDAPRTHCGCRFREGPDPFVGLYRKGYIPTSSVVTKRSAVLAAGGFDPELRNAQDFDLWLAMLREPGTPFLVFAEPLMRYHISPGSIMSHTERRLRCGLAIAVRYFPDLGTRPGSTLMSLWFRVFALHMEALNVYITQRDLVHLLVCVGALPVRLVTATAACLVRPPGPRGRFLKTPATDGDKAW